MTGADDIKMVSADDFELYGDDFVFVSGSTTMMSIAGGTPHIGVTGTFTTSDLATLNSMAMGGNTVDDILLAADTVSTADDELVSAGYINARYAPVAITGTIGGSITDNQIAIGASTANSIEGSASFTYDAGTLDINDRLNIIATGAASVPVYFQPSQDSKEIQFRAYSSNLDIMRLTDAGDVGIGHTAALNGAKLTVLDATRPLVLAYDTSNYTSFDVSNAGGLTITVPHSFVVDSSRHMDLDIGSVTREHRFLYAGTKYGYATTTDSNTFWTIASTSTPTAGMMLSGAAGSITLKPHDKDVDIYGAVQLVNGQVTSNPGTNHLWASGATLFWGGSQIGTTTPGAGAIQGTATAGQVSFGDGSNSISSTSNFTFADNDGMTITTATSNKPTLMLKNTNTDGGAGELQFYKSTASEGDGDTAGRINFYADNDAAQKTQYARIRGITQDMSDGTEDGRIEFAAMQGGTLTGLMEIGYDGNGNGINLFAGGVSGSGLQQINYPDITNAYFMFGSDLTYSSGSATYKPAGFSTDGNPDPNDSGGDQQLAIFAQDDVSISAGNYGKNGGNDIVLRTTNTAASNPTTRMRIKGDGKIGIGTDSPTAELDVRGSSSAGMAAFVSGTGNGTYPVMHVIDSADTEVAWFEGNRAGDTGAYIGVRHWPASATENARSGIKFQSKDDGGALTNYATLQMRVDDYTGGTEDGKLKVLVMADGTETESVNFSKNGIIIDEYTRLMRNTSTNGLYVSDSGGNPVKVATASGATGGFSFDNTTANTIYRGAGVSFWDSTESYRLQGNTTSGYLQLDLNKISLVRDASSAASNVLQIGDGGTYDQFSIIEDQRGSTATNGFLQLRAKKTGNFGYRKISLAAISGSTTSELMVDSISTNEALRFDTNSKSHALDIAKAGYVSIGAAVSTTDALYVNGNTTINGVLSATAKSFNIPHPLYKDKRLVHGSLEGPEHGLYTRGTIEAFKGCLIELPEYWSAMCEDYTVQLTPHGPYTVYIKEKQKDKVMVECSEENYKFDYYIVGARTDETLEVVQDG